MKKKQIPQIVKDLKKKASTLKVDYGKNKYISFSQFQTYKKCPHLWYTQHVLKEIPYQQNIYMTFGTAIHETLQDYLSLYFSKVREANKLDLHSIYETKLRELYIKNVKKNNKKHFSNPEELNEFYDDGINIIDWFLKNKTGYFSRKNEILVGIEIPVIYPLENNLYLQGFLDVVTYNLNSKTFKIIDLKTSTKGWSKWEKKDKIKNSQLVIYKRYFSKLYNIPEKDIEIEYMILKRKVPKVTDFAVMRRRIQTHTPSNGKNSLNIVERELLNFIKDSFNENGEPLIKGHYKNPQGCKFCPIKDNFKLCDMNQTTTTNFFSF